MAAKRSVLHNQILQRGRNVYLVPESTAGRRRLKRLSFAKGSDLFAAAQSLIVRLGHRPVAKSNPYKILAGLAPIARASRPRPKMRPEKQCIRCEPSGDAGYKRRKVPCRERPDA